MFDRFGDHEGSLDPKTGEKYKPAKPNYDIRDKI